MGSLLDSIGEYQLPLTAASGIGSAVCGIGLQQDWGYRSAVAWAFGIGAFVILPLISTKRNRLQQGRKAAQRCIRKSLAACGAAYGFPQRHVRVNVMLVTSSGRRQVDPQTAFNMDGDPDNDLDIGAGAGVSGEAFTQRDTFFGDLSLALQPGGPTWGLTTGERGRVRPTLRSILSVPVFDPDNADGALLGTLQVDSDLSIQEMGFDNPERRAVAERFADVVALLCKAGR